MKKRNLFIMPKLQADQEPGHQLGHPDSDQDHPRIQQSPRLYPHLIRVLCFPFG